MTPISDEELRRRVTRYETMKRALILLTAVLVAISLGVLMVLAAQGATRGKENREILDRIKSCTDSNGACHRAAQKQTATAVSNINRVIILASACSAGLPPDLTVPQRQTQIQTCVIDRLAASAHKQ